MPIPSKHNPVKTITIDGWINRWSDEADPIPLRTIRHWIETGKYSGRKMRVGKCLRFPVEDIDNFMNARMHKNTIKQKQSQLLNGIVDKFINRGAATM